MNATIALLSVMITLLLPAKIQAQGNLGSNSSPVVNRQGIPLGNVKIAVCQPLATTGASVTSNLAVLTMASNPVTAGYVAGMQILVAGFTGGDTYFNAGTLTNGTIVSGWTILSVTPTTITFTLVHANASASTNGTVLQEGNGTTPCAGLSSVYQDPALSVPATNPTTSDQLGNWNVFAASGIYYIQFYSPSTATTLKVIGVSVASLTGVPGLGLNNIWIGNETHVGTETFNGPINANNIMALINAGVFTNTQMNEYLQSLIGGISSSEFHVIGYPGYATEGISGGVAVPVGAAVLNANGVGGYVTSACNSVSRTTCNAVGGFFSGRATGNNAGIWGINPIVNDAVGLSGVNETGGEFDIGVGGTPSYVRGLAVILSPANGTSGTVPTNAIGLEILSSNSPVLQWNRGISVDDGSSFLHAIQIGATGVTASLGSQQIAFARYDAGTVRHTDVAIGATSTGGFQIFTAAGQTAQAPEFQSTVATGTPPLAVASTTPVTVLTVANHPIVKYCGATSGGVQACANTSESSTMIIFGDVTLNTATSQSITAMPFTSSSSYSCSGSDLTTAAGIVSFNTYAAASVTIAESGGVNTDHLRYVCVGF